MARTLLLRMASGITSPAAELIDRTTRAVAETITLTESATKRDYTGTITAAAGTYDINLKSGSAYIGGDEVIVAATDNTVYPANSVTLDLTGTTVLDATNVSSTLATITTAISGIAAAVWSYVARTLTTAGASSSAGVDGSDITVYRGTKWSISLTNIGALTGWTKLYFTVRTLEEQAEAMSQVQIKLTNPSAGTDGLLYLNGSSTGLTASHGAIAVVDEPTGDITITLAAAASVSCVTGTYYYDVKMITASNVTILTIGGKCTILPDITRAIS